MTTEADLSSQIEDAASNLVHAQDRLRNAKVMQEINEASTAYNAANKKLRALLETSARLKTTETQSG